MQPLLAERTKHSLKSSSNYQSELVELRCTNDGRESVMGVQEWTALTSILEGDQGMQLRPITLLSLLSVFEIVQNEFFLKRKRVEYDGVHL